MDMHMPVMDGLEAAEKIMQINPSIPIVAMTANVMTNDRDLYQSLGMKDCVGKPFKAQELWRCLAKYLKPLNWQKDDANQRGLTDAHLHQKLINLFVKNNQNKYAELQDALQSGDTKLAIRIAHTLKSNAGQLGKTLLQKAAEQIESTLSHEKNEPNHVPPGQMKTLDIELSAVLSELGPLVSEPDEPAVQSLMEAEAAIRLLDKIQPLIEQSDTHCLAYLDDLRAIADSKPLLEQMENFDFTQALQTLTAMREQLRGGDKA
jgi:CheY-like chemotaxis protein